MYIYQSKFKPSERRLDSQFYTSRKEAQERYRKTKEFCKNKTQHSFNTCVTTSMISYNHF